LRHEIETPEKPRRWSTISSAPSGTSAIRIEVAYARSLEHRSQSWIRHLDRG
jgi:hypothetical protein